MKVDSYCFLLYILLDIIVVRFVLGVYLDFFEFLGKKEVKVDVDLLIVYMKDKMGIVINLGLKSDIWDMVIVIWKVEDLWLCDKMEFM